MRITAALLALLALAACGAGGGGTTIPPMPTPVPQTSAAPVRECVSGVLTVTTNPVHIDGTLRNGQGQQTITASIDTSCNASPHDSFTATSSDIAVASTVALNAAAFTITLMQVGDVAITFTDTVTHATTTLTITAI